MTTRLRHRSSRTSPISGWRRCFCSSVPHCNNAKLFRPTCTDITTRSEVDVGFEYVAFNNRRPPFDDVKFRRALSLAIDRRLMVSAAWQDHAIPANSHVSPVLSYWHDPAVDNLKTGLAEAKKILADAGYRLVGGKLYYPAGKQEKLTTE